MAPVVAALAVLTGACAPGPPAPSATATAPTSATPSDTLPPVDQAATTAPSASLDPAALRHELLDLQAADQAERTGQAATNGDADRAARLAEIIDAHGWLSSDLVGEDGASAAWLIAQHADFDVAFQQRALGLMTDAVVAGLADASELAFLEDRVAVNTGAEQTYGTQIRCRGGVAEPATPISDPGEVDQRRAGVGLEPLADYLAIFAADCAAE